MSKRTKKAPIDGSKPVGGRSHFTEAEREKFVKIWTQAESPAEVADKMGRTVTSCQAAAVRLRKAGVNLKKFHRGSVTKINVEALNEIVESAAE